MTGPVNLLLFIIIYYSDTTYSFPKSSRPLIFLISLLICFAEVGCHAHLFSLFFFNLFLAVLGLRCCSGFSLVVASGGYSLLRCAGFSLRWLLLLWSMGSKQVGFSSCGSWSLERRLSSNGTRAQLFCDMWDPPGPGLEPVSPALTRRFLTTVTPGKSLFFQEAEREEVLKIYLPNEIIHVTKPTHQNLYYPPSTEIGVELYT